MHKIGSSSFYLLCMLGCIYQLGLVTDIFFKYETVTTFALETPDLMQGPDLSICIRYYDIFDLKAFSAHKKADLLQTSRIRLQAIASIGEILKFTPDAMNLILRCKFRKPGDYAIYGLKGEKCNQVFNVTKYYVLEYVCFMFSFQANNTKLFEFRHLGDAPTFNGVFYLLDFDKQSFIKANSSLIKAVIHPRKKHSHTSLAFAPKFWRRQDDHMNMFSLTYGILSITRLAPPYETKCRDYGLSGFTSQNNCFSDCVDSMTIRQLNKRPFGRRVKTPTNLMHVGVEDLANSTTAKIINSIDQVCKSRCEQKSCFEEFTLTRMMREPKDDFLSFYVDAPRDPFFKVTFDPKLTLTEYGIYVLSILGTWFGVSVVQFNPVSVFRRFKKAKRKHKTLFILNCCCFGNQPV